jgi:benzoyl-CoA reductase/2-hydroxyglutaryl-CoA dehydratase subunit BcrC/BadD/HgdB
MYQEQKNELREMSNQLYKLMMGKYNSTPYEERVKLFEDNTCKYCKDKYYCQINELPEDIMKPMPTNGRIPKTVGCGKNQ